MPSDSINIYIKLKVTDIMERRDLNILKPCSKFYQSAMEQSIDSHHKTYYLHGLRRWSALKALLDTLQCFLTEWLI